MTFSTRSILALAICAATPLGAGAQTNDLTQLALEDLLNVEVTSVSRKEQPLSRTAAAVHVISEEDIKRSGARTVPDLLRMVPGVSVAELDANSWAVGARGFGAFYASKLLVLIDGRAVYTPLFAGVHWEMLNVPLDDIERIEVIRGPGGSVWGANAVNGVINIITKKADATRGALARLAASGSDDVEGYTRYGATLGNRVDFRVFGRAVGRESASFEGTNDRGGVRFGGGRVDWRRSDIETVSISGTVQQGHARRLRYTPAGRSVVNEEFDQSNVVLAWTRSPSSRSESSMQLYYDAYDQGPQNGLWTVDFDARHRHAVGERHELVAGAGFRVWHNRALGYVPQHESVRLFQAFLQDEIELADRVYFTAGSKVEHNDYTGFEIQPSVRVLWQPTRAQAIWAAASRAVRTPSAGSRGYRASFNTLRSTGELLPVEVAGNPEIGSERLKAFESGYRVQFGRASLDVTAFRNVYLGLQSLEPAIVLPEVPGESPILHLTLGNGLQGNTYGAELTGKWTPWSPVRLVGSFTRLTLDITRALGSKDTLSSDIVNSTAPRYQAHGRAYVDLPGGFETSALLWRVGGLDDQQVPPYTRLDLNVGWAAARHLELRAGVQNLLHDDTAEYFPLRGNVPMPRAANVFGELIWRFR